MNPHTHTMQRGTSGDDVLHITRGGAFAFAGNDTIMAIAQEGTTQIHTYAAEGNDLTMLSFANITRFSHGHHVRGGDGSDTFDFVNTSNVSSTVVGRIEDFDPTQDVIRIEGQVLDLNNLPSNVRVVAFNGMHQDTTAHEQQWLLISTSSGGHIFYAMEGARVDMSTTDMQEGHFLLAEPDFRQLQDVVFEDRENYIPAGYVPLNGGIVIQDTDVVRADVFAQINDTAGGDLISGGLNDDRIIADRGNDRIWGGSGNDYVFAGQGNDTISGGMGNDILRSGNGNDIVYGGGGDDFIVGGAGEDMVEGGSGNDSLEGSAGHDTLLGGDGDDSLDGGHRNDFLDGGHGRDVLTGGLGGDTFHFEDFDFGFDVVTDFEAQRDKISFGGLVIDLEDLILVDYLFEGSVSTLIRFNGLNGDFDRSMGGVVIANVSVETLTVDDFLFV